MSRLGPISPHPAPPSLNPPSPTHQTHCCPEVMPSWSNTLDITPGTSPLPLPVNDYLFLRVVLWICLRLRFTATVSNSEPSLASQMNQITDLLPGAWEISTFGWSCWKYLEGERGGCHGRRRIPPPRWSWKFHRLQERYLAGMHKHESINGLFWKEGWYVYNKVSILHSLITGVN